MRANVAALAGSPLRKRQRARQCCGQFAAVGWPWRGGVGAQGARGPYSRVRSHKIKRIHKAAHGGFPKTIVAGWNFEKIAFPAQAFGPPALPCQ